MTRLTYRARSGLTLPAMCGVIAGVVVIGAGSYAVIKSVGSSGSAATRTTDRAMIRRVGFEISTTALGELESRRKVELRSQLENQAQIVEVVPEGSVIKKGDLLVKLNSDKIEQDINDVQLQFDSAKAELVAAENGYDIQKNENESQLRQARLKLELAELSLRQWLEGEVKSKRQDIQLQRDKADLELKRLAEKLVRSEELLERGFLSKDERDSDEISYIQACAAWKTSDLDHAVFEHYEYPKEFKTKQSDVDEARAELQRVELNNGIELASKDAVRSNKRQQVQLRQAKLERLETQLRNSSITAPSDGLVVYATSMERSRGWGGNEGPLQIGRNVHPNELLISLPDTSEMVAEVRVQESLAGRIRPGQRASVKVDAAGGRTFEGRVDSIGVLAESGNWRDPNLREYTVKIALGADGASDLKPSMRCEATIILGSVEPVITAPVQAVFTDGAVTFVYIEDGKQFVRRPVKLGRRSTVYAEIAAGVEENDVVLLREPSPGEVISRPWTQQELQVAGFELNSDGVAVAIGAPETTPVILPAGGPPTEAGANQGAPEGARAEGRSPGGGNRDGAAGPRRERGRRPDGAARPAEGKQGESSEQPATAPATESGDTKTKPTPATDSRR